MSAPNHKGKAITICDSQKMDEGKPYLKAFWDMDPEFQNEHGYTDIIDAKTPLIRSFLTQKQNMNT